VPTTGYGKIAISQKNSRVGLKKEGEFNSTMPTNKSVSGVGMRGPEISFTGLKKSKITAALKDQGNGNKVQHFSITPKPEKTKITKIRPFSGTKINNLIKGP
jgi:hypothetical protein